MLQKLVIAISGPPGAGSSTIAKELAKRLKLEYFSTGDVFKSYSEGKLTEQALDVWKSNLGRDKKFHEKLDNEQREKAKKGSVVVCGKLSIFTLKDLADFKIWIDSDLQSRAKRLSTRNNVPEEKALEQIEEREKIERVEWKKIYGIDYFDLKNSADLVIDGSKKTINEIVEDIIKFMRSYAKKSKTFIKYLENYEKKLAQRITKKGLTITVSGSSQSGKSTGAKNIAKRMKLKCISAGEIQRRIAKERGISLEEQVKICTPEIDHAMEKRSLEFAMRGGCVLDARLSGFVAGDWADVRVFYDCQLETRAKRYARAHNISFEEAKKIVRQRDEEDNKRYMWLYNVNMFDKSIYHLIIDNQKLTLKQAKTVPINLIKEFLRRKKKI